MISRVNEGAEGVKPRRENRGGWIFKTKADPSVATATS
jgi:hypothetical protein